MTNKSTKRALLASIMALLLCFTMLLGTTFAWFTDSVTSATNKIVAGNLDVELYHTNGTDTNEPVGDTTTLFDEVALWEPGAMVWEKLTVKNNGSLALKYNLSVTITDISTVGEKSLADALKVAVMDKQPTRENVVDAATQRLATFKLASDSALTPGDSDEFYVAIYWAPSANDNDYNVAGEQLYAKLGVTLVATQATVEEDAFGKDYDADAEYPSFVDTWDGTADTSWYNDTDTDFSLNTAEQLAGLAELVDGGNAFAGKTIKLDADMDLYAEDENGDPISFEPIGSFSDNEAFEGTFDGQGHTISDLHQNGWALQNGYWDGPEYGMGLFSLVENAVIKNINFDGASLPSEANIMGVVAGGAANCVFENISITDAYLGNHSWYSGGVIGWAEGDVKLINCDIDANSVVSSQWGDFNNANGGLIGGIDPAATIYLKDCDVTCVIDAYNDVTSAYEWYSYRNCGMLIGDTGQKYDPDGDNVGDAIAPNVTCENVTVTYGDWANYHYCEFRSSGYPFCRVEAGESTGAYGNARVGEYSDANGNKVVDDSHVHNDGEKHNELIVFDQLYGGETGDRYCTYGTATHPGVTVIYNNK